VFAIKFRRYTDQLAAGTELDFNVRNKRGMDMIGGTENFTTLGEKRVRKTVRGVTTEYTVVRDRFARTGKWERFRDPILGSSRPFKDIARDGLKNAAASAAAWLGTDMGKAKLGYTLQDFVVLPLEMYERQRAENESPDTTVSASTFSWGAAMRKGGKNLTLINKLGVFVPAIAPLSQMIPAGVRDGNWDLSTAQVVDISTTRTQQKRLEAQADTNRVRIPYTDSDALRTYADLHQRQHNYLALEWRSVAANTSTSMLSPFSRDRAAGVTSLMQSSRMVSGEVNGFDSASVVAFAEASVGGVGGDPSKTPGLFG
jgi:hypothetical protein